MTILLKYIYIFLNFNIMINIDKIFKYKIYYMIIFILLK